MTTSFIWTDGEVRPLAQAAPSALANGLHYGTGVFEGIRSYATPKGARVFRLTEHLERMRQGADCISLPFDLDAVYRGTFDALKANGLENAYIRPLTWFDGGGLGLDVDKLTPRSLVATMPWKSHLGDDAQATGVSLRTSSWRRNSRHALPPLKLCGNYVNSIIAKREATLHGYDEALFVDADSNVCEATGENVFMVRNGKITAGKHPDALPGITRATLIELLQCEERTITLDELREADEIFLTGTSAEVTAVPKFDGRIMAPNPVTREVSTLYQAVVHGHTETQRGWLHG